MPNTTIYKISSYVNWKLSGTGVVISGGGGSVVVPPAGLDGGGVAGQVAFWLDNDTLTGDEGFVYEVDSAGTGVLGVNYIRGIGDSSGANSVLFISADNIFLSETGIIGCLPEAGEADTSVVMYDPITGQLSYGTGGGDSLWEDIGGVLSPIDDHGVQIGDINITYQTIQISPTEESNGHNLTIQAGDGATAGGILTLQSGYGESNMFHGDVNISGYVINLTPDTDSFVYIVNPDNAGTKVTLQAYGQPSTGLPFYIKGGDAWAGAGDQNGGDLHLEGGTKMNAGTTGKIFVGTGSAGTNPLAGSGTGTSILLYNRTTGEITYGDK